MLAHDLNGTAQEFLEILRNPLHPFSSFLSKRTNDFQSSLTRFGVGAIVTGGQSGVETAAFQIAEELSIPTIGIGSAGLINENGEIPEKIRCQLLSPEKIDASIPDHLRLSDEEVAEENSHSTWARRKFFEQHMRLNTHFSSATLILKHDCTLNIVSSVQYHAALTPPHNHSDVFVLPFSASPTNGIGDAKWWVRSRHPVFLNILGPSEGEFGDRDSSIREEALDLLRKVFN